MLRPLPPLVIVTSAVLSRDMTASETSPGYCGSWNQRRRLGSPSLGDQRTVSSFGWMYGSDSSTCSSSTQCASIQPERFAKPGSSQAVSRSGSVNPVPW